MNRNSNSKPEVTPEVVTPEVTPEVVTPEVVTPEVTPEVVTPEVVTPEVVTPEAGPKLQTGAEIAARFKLGTDPKADTGMSPLRDSTLAYVTARAASSKGASRLCWEAVATAVATCDGVCRDWPTEDELLALTPGSIWAKLRNSRSRRSHLTRAARYEDGKGVVLATVDGVLAVVGWFKGGDVRLDHMGRSYVGKIDPANVAAMEGKVYVTACIDMEDVTPDGETAEAD